MSVGEAGGAARLDGKVVLLTGATGTIGTAIAVAAAEAGASIVAVGRDRQRLDRASASIEAAGQGCLSITANLAEATDLQAVPDRAWEWRGRVDVLVNAAGILFRRDDDEIPVEEWDATVAVNLRAPFYLMRMLGERMRAAGGSIVNVTSVAGEVVTRAPGAYQVSKAGLIQATRYFAAKLAPTVRVNAVGPGYIRTAINAEWLAHEPNERYVVDNTLLGRVGAPDDVVPVVLFLASDASAYVTGQHLLVDGGWTCR